MSCFQTNWIINFKIKNKNIDKVHNTKQPKFFKFLKHPQRDSKIFPDGQPRVSFYLINDKTAVSAARRDADAHYKFTKIT